MPVFPKAEPRKRQLGTLVVTRQFSVSGHPAAKLKAGSSFLKAAIGKTLMAHRKREGDGATPVGSFLLSETMFRSDRGVRSRQLLPNRPIRPTDAWCDDPASSQYNRPTSTACRARHETLWRDDRVYDVIVPTSHNQVPRVRNGGSAIFLHLARPNYGPTEGCVAISEADMRRLLPRLARKTKLVIRLS